MLTAAPQLLDMEIFSCGPPPYMEAVREILDMLGAEPARCHEESFLLGADNPIAEPPATGMRHQVQFTRSGQTIECDESTSLLTAAAQAGLTLPSSCGEGVCGTGKCLLRSGEVDIQHAGGIRQREIDQGKILLCSSRRSGPRRVRN